MTNVYQWEFDKSFYFQTKNKSILKNYEKQIGLQHY